MVKIESFLNRKGMSKADLCRAFNIDSKSSIFSSYEKGRAYPSYETCLKLLEMGMTVEELFGISEAEKNVEKISSLKDFVELFQKSMNETLDSVKKNL